MPGMGTCLGVSPREEKVVLLLAEGSCSYREVGVERKLVAKLSPEQPR